MHDLIIIGAGPGGIALAAEAFASGIDPSQILILEKVRLTTRQSDNSIPKKS